jgi:hypothetical protein
MMAAENKGAPAQSPPARPETWRISGKSED